MRTNIVIDDSLMHDALKATGLKTKKEAVELGLKMLIKLNQQHAIKAFRGKLTWQDNPEKMGDSVWYWWTLVSGLIILMAEQQ